MRCKVSFVEGRFDNISDHCKKLILWLLQKCPCASGPALSVQAGLLVRNPLLEPRVKVWRPVLVYSGRFWSFWASKIDSGRPDGSRHTKRELGSLSETRFRSFSSEV